LTVTVLFLWGSVFCICCWPSPAYSFSGTSQLGLVAIFYCLFPSSECCFVVRFEFATQQRLYTLQYKIYIKIIHILKGKEHTGTKILWRRYITKYLGFLTWSTVLFLFKTQRFGDWIVSPSSGGTYPVRSNRWIMSRNTIFVWKRTYVYNLSRKS
jgi:hypothetical protein